MTAARNPFNGTAAMGPHRDALGAFAPIGFASELSKNDQEGQRLERVGQLDDSPTRCTCNRSTCWATYVLLHSHVRQFVSFLTQSRTVLHKSSRFGEDDRLLNIGVWPNFLVARPANVGALIAARRASNTQIPTVLLSTVASSCPARFS
jgi:hypothetical protein